MTGSYERVEVTDLGELAKAFRDLSDGIDEILVKAMMGALINGGFAEKLSDLVPESNPAKYASRQVDPLEDRDWQTRNKDIKGGENGKSYARYRQYGNQNLKKSFFDGLNSANPSLKAEKLNDGVGVVVSSSVRYAPYVHEAEKPAKGEYWSGRPGEPGWSKRGSGSHFIDEAFEQTSAEVEDQLVKNIEAQLRRLGLL